MGRILLGIVAGFAVWMVMWLGGGAAVRALSPESFPQDGPITDVGTLLAILGLSVACSVVAGLVCQVAGRGRTLSGPVALGVLLLVVGVAVQVGVWSTMPVWHHVAFLGLLLPATVIGGLLGPRRAAPAP